MKRSPLPPRKAPIKRSTKRIPPINVDASRKRQARRQAKKRASNWPAVRKAALERADYRCEYTDPETGLRCDERTDLEVHELRYTKIRDEVLLDDVQVLDRAHHRYLESLLYGYRASRRRYLATVEGKR